jgi:hypothetical protein
MSPAPTAIRRTKAPFSRAAELRSFPKMKAASAAMRSSAGLMFSSTRPSAKAARSAMHPHGSVNAKLLTVRDANLCLKCHFQQQSRRRAPDRRRRSHPPRPGRHLLDGRLPRGGAWFPRQSNRCASDPKNPAHEITARIFFRKVTGTVVLGGLLGLVCAHNAPRRRCGRPDTNAPPALTPEQMFEGGTNSYNNWVDFPRGQAFVSGDKRQFQQQQQMPAGAFGGISDFHFQTGIATNTTMTLDGRGHC